MTLLAIVWVTDAGRCLREAALMCWETWWALVLGFTLSGAVQAFVPRAALQRQLGTHRPSAVARAAAYGMASSSCSYAAAAMAKSLFQKGADFVTAIVFMVASTNLVVELGLVLVVLMGWRFTVAEFVGGPIMIALLAVVGGAAFGGQLLDRVRTRLAGPPPSGDHIHAAGARTETAPETWRSQLASRDEWSTAASYSVGDVRMLWRELLLGFGVAGCLAVLVPNAAWNAVFLHGDGTWTTLENALVAPFVAMLSFVCSIGNVPLAAALWHGGASFGGVLTFLLADLLAVPLLLVYRRAYGTAVAVRLGVVLYVVMVLAGLCTHALFAAAGAVPAVAGGRLPVERFTWGTTTDLDLAALALGGAVVWLHRTRRHGEGRPPTTGHACGMAVSRQVLEAPLASTLGGATLEPHERRRDPDETVDERVHG